MLLISLADPETINFEFETVKTKKVHTGKFNFVPKLSNNGGILLDNFGFDCTKFNISCSSISPNELPF